jgi:hypothetical protein
MICLLQACSKIHLSSNQSISVRFNCLYGMNLKRIKSINCRRNILNCLWLPHKINKFCLALILFLGNIHDFVWLILGYGPLDKVIADLNWLDYICICILILLLQQWAQSLIFLIIFSQFILILNIIIFCYFSMSNQSILILDTLKIKSKI